MSDYGSFFYGAAFDGGNDETPSGVFIVEPSSADPTTSCTPVRRAHEDFRIKRNDLLPVLERRIRDDSGAPLNLTTAESVRFVMRRPNGAVVVDGDCTIEDREGGIVSYEWTEGDTATKGAYVGEFEVTFEDGKVLTAPTVSYLKIKVVEDLG